MAAEMAVNKASIQHGGVVYREEVDSVAFG